MKIRKLHSKVFATQYSGFAEELFCKHPTDPEAGYGKHLVLIKAPKDITGFKIGDLVPEGWTTTPVDQFYLKTPSFSWAHFPVGTVCEIQLDHGESKEPFRATVTKLAQNGVNSYVIYTDLPCKLTDVKIVNIGWVKRIIKRGPGIAVIGEHLLSPLKGNMRRYGGVGMAVPGGFLPPKGKNQYLTYSPRDLVAVYLSDYVKDGYVLDASKLLADMQTQGVFREVPLGNSSIFERYVYFCSKKRFHQVFRRLVNKHLRRLSVAEREEREEMDCLYQDWDEDLDYLDETEPNDDFYEVGDNRHGHPQMYQHTPERDIPVCCSCKSIMMENKGQGMACEECQAEFIAECRHDT